MNRGPYILKRYIITYRVKGSYIYLETCPLWRPEWKSGAYFSHKTAGGSMRLILPDRNNFL